LRWRHTNDVSCCIPRTDSSDVIRYDGLLFNNACHGHSTGIKIHNRTQASQATRFIIATIDTNVNFQHQNGRSAVNRLILTVVVVVDVEEINTAPRNNNALVSTAWIPWSWYSLLRHSLCDNNASPPKWNGRLTLKWRLLISGMVSIINKIIFFEYLSLYLWV
jgi:hypothetical protein